MASSNVFELEIVVPEKVYCRKNIVSISVKTSEGVMTILAHHTSLIATLPIDHMTINENGHILHYAIAGGTMHVDHDHNKVTLVLNAIESKDEIDLNRADKAKMNAQNKLKDPSLPRREQLKAEIKLKRALNRISLLQK
jgi:F-type H+-transporting ATPase subunit epsilon